MMIKKTFLFLWQLPQTIIGFFAIVLLDAYKPCAIYDVDVWLHYKTSFTSVSLGMFIIMNGYKYTEKDIKHEMGHQIQSRSLGWLYIPLIGLPSVIGNLLFRIPAIRKRFNYYNLPWEKSADKLGEVTR